MSEAKCRTETHAEFQEGYRYDERKPLGRRRPSWQNNRIVVYKYRDWEYEGWIYVIKDRKIAGTCDHGIELSK